VRRLTRSTGHTETDLDPDYTDVIASYPQGGDFIHADFETVTAATLTLIQEDAEVATCRSPKCADIETRLDVIHAESGTTSYRVLLRLFR
jgi:hypothetical protein